METKPKEKTGTDNLKAGVHSDPVFEHLPDSVCRVLVRNAKKYRKIMPLRAIKMDEPFSVDSGHGVAEGKAGDWLADDNRGKFYPIDAEEFGRTYRPFRKPRTKPSA